MNNTFLKNTILTLTLRLLLNTSIATNDAYDDEYSESISSATAKQVSPQYVEDQIEERQIMVFSGEPLLNIGSYLGRQETGRLQQVSKSVKHFFNQEKDTLQLWKSYAQQLQLEIADDIKVEDLILRIKNYYNLEINIFEVTSSDLGKSKIIIRTLKNIRNGKMKIIKVMYTDGKIECVAFSDNGCNSRAKVINADGRVIGGWIKDGQNGNGKTAIIWNWQGIVSLNNYPFKQSHDYLCKVSEVSNDGSDFIVQSDTGKTYKAHIPRYNLWKMR